MNTGLWCSLRLPWHCHIHARAHHPIKGSLKGLVAIFVVPPPPAQKRQRNARDAIANTPKKTDKPEISTPSSPQVDLYVLLGSMAQGVCSLANLPSDLRALSTNVDNIFKKAGQKDHSRELGNLHRELNEVKVEVAQVNTDVGALTTLVQDLKTALDSHMAACGLDRRAGSGLSRTSPCRSRR